MDSESYFMGLDDVTEPSFVEFDSFVNYDGVNASRDDLDGPWRTPDGNLETGRAAESLQTSLPDLAFDDLELPAPNAGSLYPTTLDLEVDTQGTAENDASHTFASNDFEAWLDAQVQTSQYSTEFDALIATLDEHFDPATTSIANDIPPHPAHIPAVGPQDHVVAVAEDIGAPATAPGTRLERQATLEREYPSQVLGPIPPQKGAQWTAEDDDLLLKLKDERAKPWKLIAEHLGRGVPSCQVRLFKLRERAHAAAEQSSATLDPSLPTSKEEKRRRSSPGLASREHESKLGRTGISSEARRLLEGHFELNPYIEADNIQPLSDLTNLSRKQIRTWFANTRSRKVGVIDPSNGPAVPHGLSLQSDHVPALCSPSFAAHLSMKQALMDYSGEPPDINASARRSTSIARSDTSTRSIGSAMSSSSFRSIDLRGPRRGRKGWAPPPPNADWRPEPAPKEPEGTFLLSFPRIPRPRDLQTPSPRRETLKNGQGHVLPQKEPEVSAVNGVNCVQCADHSTCHSTTHAKVMGEQKCDTGAALKEKTNRRFFCTWPDCDKTFRYRYDWKRHEEAKHYCPYHWVCCLDSDVNKHRRISRCLICSKPNQHIRHVAEHEEFETCAKRDQHLRTFYRHDQLVQHVRTHLTDGAAIRSLAGVRLTNAWKIDNPHIDKGAALWCSFCWRTFDNWEQRTNHVGDHFINDDGGSKVTKADWTWPDVSAAGHDDQISFPMTASYYYDPTDPSTHTLEHASKVSGFGFVAAAKGIEEVI